ncbi:site-specific recombinase [Janthinobacterium agaricidamnosum]|uniref:Putative membrane protein n=1 Tax=Janthinobacterium agaricidamnosum NBRC 102515 = DSM 9628 TaxID=1349767 RepID=W0V922_9BURK|nr:site-specific recombinase [Janthinobacterium agaricidamnosum]CDG84376.1 putative membrane protein [Janthinobacterium agaricidamnosum NBRC 102515 = DSM 9628]
MLAILERIDSNTSTIDLLVDLFNILRPKRPSDGASATANVRTLCQLLKGNPKHARALHEYVLRILGTRRHNSLYTDVGILSNDGFFTELKRRISYRILPPALGDEYLNDALGQVLYLTTDYLWIASVPAADWLDLCNVLANADDPDEPVQRGNIMLPGMLDAIRTLSYRICAIGLEPELTKFHTEIEIFHSPFMVQNTEVNAYLEGYARLLIGDNSGVEDARHLLVMLDQCDAVIVKIRKKALYQGTSIALTYLLVSLSQSIERLRKLLFLVDITGQLPGDPALAPDTPVSPRQAAAVALALELIEAHNNKYAVRDLFADNINLLARNVTENASRTGEHYIAEDRKQLGGMFLSSAGAGLVIGFMALFKILMSYLRSAPLVEAFMFSMNYSIGFMFIHLLHFTVATKQPAMTASRIAAGLHSNDGRNIDLDSMAELINKVFRTQVIAVLGNLATAIPTAYAIALGYKAVSGHHLVSPDKAMHLLHDIDPIGSPALFYAMIAGICLFVSGLISGYYDNQALYTRWAQRISQLRGLGWVIGQQRLKRLGLYLENNLGGLMGNFYFGILLGSIGTLGFLLGLPIDIRHVTFSAANFATALVGLDHNMSWQLATKSIAGFLGIGTVNLLVSFGLALWVALRSRQVRFKHGLQLLKLLGKRFLNAPLDFFIGSKNPAPPMLEDDMTSIKGHK